MTDEIARFLVEACGLKREPRRGWLEYGIDRAHAESVADHSFGTALAVLLIAHERAADIDLERALSLAVVHDLAEVRTGDITPADGIPKEEKASQERAALEAMVADLPGRDHWLGLFDEYQRGESAEARFVRACDKLEMSAQGVRYEGDRAEAFDASPFHRSAERGVDADPRVRAVFDALMRQRSRATTKDDEEG